MKDAWQWWVARRYLKTRRKEKKNLITLLSIVGLALGVATLITVLAVMNGFQGGTIRVLLEFQSFHIRVEKEAAALLSARPDAAGELLRQVPQLRSVTKFAETQGMFSSDYSNPRAAMIRTVDNAELEWLGATIPEIRPLEGSLRFTGPDQVILGGRLAGAMGIKVGDTVRFLSFDGRGSSTKDFPLQVVGLITFSDVNRDAAQALVHVEGALGAAFAPEMSWGIRLHDSESDREAMTAIQAFLASLAGEGAVAAAGSEASGGTPPGRVISWRDYNASIFGALRMEKIMMALIISLMFVVIGVNIFHDMRVSVMEKQEDIGVLKALGAPAVSIQGIFLAQGLLLGLGGSLGGLGLGVLLSTNVNGITALVGSVGQALGIGTFHLPPMSVEMNLVETVLTAFAAIPVGVLAAWSASAAISRMDAAAILRYE